MSDTNNRPNLLYKLKCWIHLVETCMTDPPRDTTLIDRWLEEAEELAEGFDFDEEGLPS
jgi:hypothetical protein